MSKAVFGVESTYFPEFVLVQSDDGYHKMVPDRVTRKTRMGLCSECDFVLQPMYCYCPKCGARIEMGQR